jgi:hypothetical protein
MRQGQWTPRGAAWRDQQGDERSRMRRSSAGYTHTRSEARQKSMPFIYILFFNLTYADWSWVFREELT